MATERVPAEKLEGPWTIENGTAKTAEPREGPWRDDSVEDLTYSNPFGQDLERVWFDGKVVYAAELGELEVDLETTKVAQEYQIVHHVELDEHGKLVGEPDRVPGQYNIYDSVPGMDAYSPLWQFNYVVVPRDFEPNTLRSERDCLDSGYEIRKSTIVEN